MRSRRPPLGQHFLTDRGAAARIVAALAPLRTENVLEIGPGRGALTTALIEAARRVAAVELDPLLASELRERFAGRELILVRDDILKVDLCSLIERLGGARWVVAGNLPYNISKPVALKLVRDRALIDRAVLMFQREVAERLTASPGTKAYGALSVLTGETYEVRALFDLPPAAFRPRPRVDSRVTLWQRKPLSALGAAEERRLRTCLSVCFAKRRKTLRNNLRSSLGSAEAVDALLDAAELDGSERAEAVPPQGFRRLARAWPGALTTQPLV